MGLHVVEIFYFLHCGDRLYTSECDICGRQILTYKNGPRAETVFSNFHPLEVVSRYREPQLEVGGDYS